MHVCTHEQYGSKCPCPRNDSAKPSAKILGKRLLTMISLVTCVWRKLLQCCSQCDHTSLFMLLSNLVAFSNNVSMSGSSQQQKHQTSLDSSPLEAQNLPPTFQLIRNARGFQFEVPHYWAALNSLERPTWGMLPSTSNSMTLEPGSHSAPAFHQVFIDVLQVKSPTNN